MTNLLLIQSSPNAQQSISNELIRAFEQQFEREVPDVSIIKRDIASSPVSALNELTLSAFFNEPEQHTVAQQMAIKESDDLINELKIADVIVIAAPMHNFTVSTALKAYIDHIARAGKTFKYTSNGPQGLLTNKKVYVITTAGGDYRTEPMKSMDFLTPYLKQVLAFMGMDDVEFIQCFGVAGGDEAATAAKNNALATMSELIVDYVTIKQNKRVA